MKQSTGYIVGFTLFMFGILSLLLNLIGLQFMFLGWLNVFGDLGSFLIRLGMIFGGMIIIVIARMDINNSDY